MTLRQDRPLFGFVRPIPPGPRTLAEMRCRLLEVMAASVRRDVPLGPVVAAAAMEQRGCARRARCELRDLLDAGVRLGAALRSCRHLGFPEHTVAAIEAADGTPRLAPVLAASSLDDAAIENRRAAVWASLFYPLLVVALAGGVAGGIVGPTRQKLVEVFASMEVDLSARGGSLLETAMDAGRIGGALAIGTAWLVAAVWLMRRIPGLTLGLSGVFRSMSQRVPGLRGPARLGAASRLLRALAASVRSAMPLHEALRIAAPAAACAAVSKSALAAAALCDAGAPLDEVAAALLLPPAVRARFALAATRSPDGFADALGPLAEDCAARYHAALEARMRLIHPAATVFVAAIVFTQILALFTLLAALRQTIPTW